MRIHAMGSADEACSALEALPLRAGSEGLFSEAWLQNLIQQHPALLPVSELEPALTPLTPVCLELPLPSGYADNLLMTPSGGLVLVETKLWRNPEARREVVGQVLDYAKDLARWTYSDLQQAVRLATKVLDLDLFRHVVGQDADDTGEAEFIDHVSRNLRQGRFLLLIAGDGIQEGVEQLADFLQRHMGLHFSLALVELAFWKAPGTGDVIIQPKVVARTVQIERAVVRAEAGVSLTPSSLAPASPQAKPATLSWDAFMEGLRQVSADLPDRLQAFLTDLEGIGVTASVRRGMTLRWRSPSDQDFRLAHIAVGGSVAFDWAHGPAEAIGRVDLSHAYLHQIAAAIPGAVVRRTPSPVGWRVVIEGRDPPLRLLLDHQSAWLDAITAYLAALEAAVAVDAPASRGGGSSTCRLTVVIDRQTLSPGFLVSHADAEHPGEGMRFCGALEVRWTSPAKEAFVVTRRPDEGRRGSGDDRSFRWWERRVALPSWMEIPDDQTHPAPACAAGRRRCRSRWHD